MTSTLWVALDELESLIGKRSYNSADQELYQRITALAPSKSRADLLARINELGVRHEARGF